MRIHAFAGEERIYSKTYYSIGGGFIVDEEHSASRCWMKWRCHALQICKRAAGALS